MSVGVHCKGFPYYAVELVLLDKGNMRVVDSNMFFFFLVVKPSIRL